MEKVIRFLGGVELKITIGQFTAKHSFNVSPLLQYAILFGKDFFKAHEAILDFRLKAIKVNTPNISSVQGIKEKEISSIQGIKEKELKNKHKITIKPKHEALVPLRVPIHMKNHDTSDRRHVKPAEATSTRSKEHSKYKT